MFILQNVLHWSKVQAVSFKVAKRVNKKYCVTNWISNRKPQKNPRRSSATAFCSEQRTFHS